MGSNKETLFCMISSDALRASVILWSTEWTVSTVEFTLQLTLRYLRLPSYYCTVLLSSPIKSDMGPKAKPTICLNQLTPRSAGYHLCNTVSLNKSSISPNANQQQQTSKRTKQCCWRKVIRKCVNSYNRMRVNVQHTVEVTSGDICSPS